MSAQSPMFDRYSLAHSAWGSAFAAAGVSPPVAIGSHLLFEVVEDRVKEAQPSLWPDPSPDSLENHLGDVLSFMAGYGVTRKVPKGNERTALVAGLVVIGAAVWVTGMRGAS